MRIEIVPKNDLNPHTIGGMCKCWPDLLFEANGSIIVKHNAYDGRLALEEAREILNIDQTPNQWEIITE